MHNTSPLSRKSIIKSFKPLKYLYLKFKYQISENITLLFGSMVPPPQKFKYEIFLKNFYKYLNLLIL